MDEHKILQFIMVYFVVTRRYLTQIHTYTYVRDQ
jgi:hypothetical protein